MITTAPMKYLAAMILAEDADNATRALLAEGALDFINISQAEESEAVQSLAKVSPEINQEKAAELRRRIDSFLELGGFSSPDSAQLSLEDLKPAKLEESEAFLAGVSGSLEKIRESQRAFQQKIERYSELERALAQGNAEQADLNALAGQSYIGVRAGRVNTLYFADLKNALQAYPAVLEASENEKETRVKLAFLKRDEKAVDALLDRFHWSETPLEDIFIAPEEGGLSQIRQKLADAKKEQEALRWQAKEIVGQKKRRLDELWINLRLNELYGRVQNNFSRTAKTYLFAGWLPTNKVKSVAAALYAATNGRAVVETASVADMKKRGGNAARLQAPTELENPKIIRPFQLVIRNYGTPAYGTLDPTWIVSIFFTLMFGLMFADVGQGFVVFLLGLAAFLSARKKENGKTDFGLVIMYCGFSSILFGVLFGSYFGYQIFNPLWFDFHGIAMSGHAHFDTGSAITDVMGIFGVSLKFGLAVIGSGLLFNWINRIRRGDMLHLILDKSGLIGAAMYVAGVYAVWGYCASGFKRFPAHMDIVGDIIAAGVLLFALLPPLHFFASRKANKNLKFKPSMLAEWTMEWLIEVLELFIGYMSNTLSFLRIAALGIAHAVLMGVFYQLAEGMPFAAAIAVKVFANVLVIGLEGLSAGVNSMRLNYYEFFSRYFIGSGRPYAPVSLSRSNG